MANKIKRLLRVIHYVLVTNSDSTVSTETRLCLTNLFQAGTQKTFINVFVLKYKKTNVYMLE